MPKSSYTDMILQSFAAAAVLVCPGIALFFANKNQFTTTTAESLTVFSVCASIVFLFFFTILASFRKQKFYPFLYAALPALSVAVILQYYCLSDYFGVFDISSPDALLTDKIIICGSQILLLALPFVLSFIFRKQCLASGAKIALVIIFTQLTALAVSISGTKSSAAADYDFKEFSFSDEKKFTFGSKENMIIIVVDCMGEEIIKYVLQKFPELNSTLKDFVCFDRMNSPSPTTSHAVPALLTGINYSSSGTGKDDHADYLKSACRAETSLFQLAKQHGFRREGYPFFLQTISYSPEVIDNSILLNGEIKKISVLKMYKTVLARFMPVFLNNMISKDLPFIIPGSLTVYSLGKSYDQIFMSRLCNEFAVGTDQKVFKYLHLQGAHGPMLNDENLQTSYNILKYQQLRGSFKVIETLLAKMKEKGIYDNAMIVIVGDHTERYTPEIAAFIKLPHSKRTHLTFNSVNCEIADIAATAAKEYNWLSDAPSLFSAAPVAGSSNASRVKRMFFQKFPPWKKGSPGMQINTPSRDLDGGGVVQGKTILIEFDGSATALTASDLMICAEKLDDASLYFTKLSNLQDCRYLLLDNTNLPEGDYKMILTEYRGK